MMKSKILATTAAICLATLSLAGCAGHSVGETIDDSTITAKVKTALLSEDAMTASGVNVETYKGTVALIGYVSNDDDKSRAIRAARGVDDSPRAKRGCSPRSRRSTCRPRWTSMRARIEPAKPDPTMTISRSTSITGHSR